MSLIKCIVGQGDMEAKVSQYLWYPRLFPVRL